MGISHNSETGSTVDGDWRETSHTLQTSDIRTSIKELPQTVSSRETASVNKTGGKLKTQRQGENLGEETELNKRTVEEVEGQIPKKVEYLRP